MVAGSRRGQTGRGGERRAATLRRLERALSVPKPGAVCLQCDPLLRGACSEVGFICATWAADFGPYRAGQCVPEQIASHSIQPRFRQPVQWPLPRERNPRTLLQPPGRQPCSSLCCLVHKQSAARRKRSSSGRQQRRRRRRRRVLAGPWAHLPRCRSSGAACSPAWAQRPSRCLRVLRWQHSRASRASTCRAWTCRQRLRRSRRATVRCSTRLRSHSSSRVSSVWS